MNNLKEYNFDFQVMIDELTIQELKQFKDKLVRVYAQRIAKEHKTTNERLKELNYLENKQNNLV